MSFEIVKCRVLWRIMIGYSGNELAPVFKAHSDHETEGDAAYILANTKFTRRQDSGWWRDESGYGSAYITRVLEEIK